jgi:hypothetical protein
MKLFIEKHPELLRLAQHLHDIEKLAEKLGMDVDDLNPGTSPGLKEDSFLRSEKSIAGRRARLFINHSGNQAGDLKRSCSDLKLLPDAKKL